MVDFAAGHVTSEQSHPIVAALDDALGDGRDGVRFHPGVEYRHLCVVPRDLGDAECVPPHDLTGRPSCSRPGRRRPKLIALMDASKPVVRDGGRRGRFDRDADLALGPGHAPAAARLRRRATASPAGCRRRSTSCAGSACSPGSRWSTSPARPRASTTTTSRSATPRSRRSPTATSSSSTSRRPTKPATRARSTRRWRRSSGGTPRSSARSSTRSTASLPRSSCCPTTRRRARRVPTRRTRCRTSSSTRRSPGAGGEYTERGVAGCTPVVAHHLMARLVALTPHGGWLPRAVERAVQ